MAAVTQSSKPCDWDEQEVCFLGGKRAVLQVPGPQAGTGLCPCHWFRERSPGRVLLFQVPHVVSAYFHWPRLGHMATTSFRRGWAVRSVTVTQQPCAQWKPAALVVKKQSSGTWRRTSCLYHNSNPDAQANPDQSTPDTLFIHSTGLMLHGDYQILKNWVSLCSFGISFPDGTSGKESTRWCRRHKRQFWSLDGEEPLE